MIDAQQHDAKVTDPATSLGAAASLEHLTGASRGMVSWLNAGSLAVHLSAQNTLRVVEAEANAPPDTEMARLHRAKGSYELVSGEAPVVWVNSKPVRRVLLVNGDIIEFGESGPLSRFHLHRDGRGDKQTVAAILRDGFDYLRVSRQPWPKRIVRAVATLARRLLRETTVLFRLAVVVAIAVLVGVAYQQHQLNSRLEQALQSSSARLEQVTSALARARREALRASDLTALREDMAKRLVTQTERLAALEKRSGASARVIAESVAAVAFLQGAYGFREKNTARVLRRVLDSDGQPVITPFGQPLLSLDGDGPPVEIEYTGTGFAIAGTSVLVTNRHVALPWEGASSSPGGDLEPVMSRFQAYFPGRADPVAIKLIQASDAADLALIRVLDDAVLGGAGLELSTALPKQGDEVIVLGYPTGLRSLLAQSGEAFIKELQKAAETDFWEVSKRLARGGFIAPLASRGIIGQATKAAVVYDAETTHGGSGGPVLDVRGRIVAVNAAILPEYGGSNFGVPVVLLKTLLREAGFR